VDPVTKTTI